MLNLDIKIFANFAVEKTIRTPCNRAKFPASGVWDQPKCPYKSAILWRQIFHCEKIGVRILYVLFLWARRESRGLGRSRDYKIWIYLTATRQGVARYS
jgi:hypothetical protein